MIIIETTMDYLPDSCADCTESIHAVEPVQHGDDEVITRATWRCRHRYGMYRGLKKPSYCPLAEVDI